MRLFKLLTFSSILLVALSLTRAWGSDISREEQCPGEDTWNRSHPDAVEVGDRTSGNEGHYPNDDIKAVLVEGKWRFEHKDGKPY